MRIQHNIMAMNAYRNYSNNTSALSKNLEKLSSGYKINRAGDDAAGLAISEKMRAQITGLSTAQKNAKDGISLVQTAEGALTEVHSMLNRMVELADQSANGTYDDATDRANLQKEFDALRSEIDRISKATNFNGINLLDGTQKATDLSAIKGLIAGAGVDGTDPSAATNAEFTLDIDSTDVTVTDVTVGGKAAKETAATANEWKSGALAQGAANQDFKLTVKYNDATGAAKTKDLTVTTGAAAADTFKAIQDAVANDADLKGLFEVKGDATGVKFTSKAAGVSNVKITSMEIDNGTGTGGVTLGGSALAVKDTRTVTVTDGTGATSDGESITLGGVTYTATTAGGGANEFKLSDVATGDAFLQKAIDAYNADAAQGYSATLAGSAITFTAKTAGAVAGDGPAAAPTMTSTMAATTLGAVTAGTAGVDIDKTVTVNPAATVGADANYDLSGPFQAGDKLTIGGKTYAYDATVGAGAGGADGKFSDFAGLQAAAALDGVTVGGTQAAATFKATAITVKGGGLPNITTGTTTYKQLGDGLMDGKKISDLFNVEVNGQQIDLADAAHTFQAGDKVKFIAKTPGEVSAGMMAKFDGITGANVTKVNGVDEGAGGAASKATYDLKFNFDKLAGGQTFELAGKTFELTLDGTASKEGNVAINIGNDLTSAAGKLAAAQAIQAAVNGELGASFDSSAPAAADVTGADFTLKLTAKTAGESGNLGQAHVSDNPEAIDVTYVPGQVASVGGVGTFAQVSYDVDLSKLSVGDKIKIGSTEIEVVADADVDRNNGKISLADAQNTDKLATAFETAGYNKGKIAFSADGKTMTITDAQQTGGTAAALANGAGKASFTSGSGVTLDGGLTLQIGDTSDAFNQITVDIAKMDSASLGIGADAVNINNQENAQSAVAAIKSSINSVSSTRGGLGALQNRLEHTINNLSVMQENIQDAESSIRDVDVADEMMAYTKNNILVQSAQAMLAQANQVPQGVLQLLQ